MDDFILKLDSPTVPHGIVTPPDLRRKKSREAIQRKKDIAIEANIYTGVSMTGPLDIPVIKEYKVEIPERMLPYGAWNSTRDLDAAVCFYTHEYRYGLLKTNCEKVIEKIKRAPCVVFPDFSQTNDMPYWERFHNSCLNKALGAKFQQAGINVVANVTWSQPDSYDYCFVGLPQHCVIAINSMGANVSGTTRYLWRQGYEKALEVLEPTFILRYGPKMPGERTDISKYYSNPFIEGMRHGSKR